MLGIIERIEEGERNLGVIDSDDFMLEGDFNAVRERNKEITSEHK